MNLTLAFKYVQQDKDWIMKLLVVGLISLIPIIGSLYLTGWFIEISRRVSQNEETILPDVKFGPFIKAGFKMLVLSFVYMLPVSVIYGFLMVFMAAFSGSDTSTAQFLALVTGCFGGLVIFLLSLVISVFLMAGCMRLIKTGQLRDGFDFSAIWKMVKGNFQTFIILFLVNLLCSLIGSLGIIFCVIGMLFTIPYSMAVYGHLFGQGMQQIEQTGNL